VGSSKQRGWFRSGGDSDSDNLQYNQTKVPLLTSHDIYGLQDGHAFAWISGVADTVRLYVPGWFEITRCEELVAKYGSGPPSPPQRWWRR
jgi:hypothetical protein